MRDKKYCVIVAKEYIIDENDDMKLRVVGMAEMGMSICPISKDTKLSPQPTLGVLCVSPNHQQTGIGKALVEKCEQIATDIWKDCNVVVDIEPSNHIALSFFERCGYHISEDDSGEKHMRNTTVVRRRKAESRPHYLLRKKLAISLQEGVA